MQICTLDAQRRNQRCTKNDVGQLTDGRKRQTALQMVLTQSDERGNNNARCRSPGQHIDDADFCQQLRPKDEANDT